MVNASLNWASIVGIVLAVGGVLLYALRTIKPALSRDYDVFFSAVGLLCGGILLFQGWRLDPILQVGQFLLAATTVFFAYESVRLRGVTTEQARRNEMLDDPDDVPFHAPMGYGLDEQRDAERFEWREPVRRRIRGTREEEERPDPYRMARPTRAAIPERSSGRPDAPSPSYRQRQGGAGDGDLDQFEPQDPRGGGSSGWEDDGWGSGVSRPGNGRQTRYGRPSASGRRESSPSRAQPRDSGDVFGARRQQRESRLSQRRGAPTDGRGRERPLLPRRRAARGNQQQPEPFDQDPRLAAATSLPRSSQPPAGQPIAAKPRRGSHQNSGTAPVQRSPGPPGGMTDAAFSPVTGQRADPRNPRGTSPSAGRDIEQDNSARFDD